MSSADKIKLTSFDDLFGADATAGADQVQEIPLSDLFEFKGHPFKVLDDEKMQETVESIKNYGVLMPGIARPRKEGGYEIISGHRRKHGCELAGLSSMPMYVRDYNDDEATIIMVDSNIQRENILPSEKAWAYRLKLEAIKHQGAKGEKYTAELVGEASGDSGRTVQRFIRLTYLTRELLDHVDQGKLPTSVAEKLSYLTEAEQRWVCQLMITMKVGISGNQAELLKEESTQETLTHARALEILQRKLKSQVSSLPAKKIRKYFPADYSREQMESVIVDLLEAWSRGQA
jgi:ParB family chromosome partitioning protein